MDHRRICGGMAPMGGWKTVCFQKLALAQKLGPKDSFFMKIGIFDAENHEESENRIGFSPQPLKKTNKIGKVKVKTS